MHAHPIVGAVASVGMPRRRPSPVPGGERLALALSLRARGCPARSDGRRRRWRVASGRAFPGAHGVARSYEEAREALQFADRMGLDTDVLDARDVLVHRVLGRDQAAIVDLVRDVPGPLQHSRTGAEVLLETLLAYSDAGDVASEAARRLHVSVRTVTYRLARVAEPTGYSVARPVQRFSLHAAVLGARLLVWPTRPLPVEP